MSYKEAMLEGKTGAKEAWLEQQRTPATWKSKQWFDNWHIETWNCSKCRLRLQSAFLPASCPACDTVRRERS